MVRKLLRIIKHHPLIEKYLFVYSQLPKNMRKNFCYYWRYGVLLGYLQEGNHGAIAKKIQNSKGYQHSFFLHIYAKSCFLQGKYSSAMGVLDSFLDCYPHYADAVYLKSEILSIQNDKEQAWQLLSSFLLYSKRKKTWQFLANLVDSKIDFDNYLLLFKQYFPKWQNGLDYDLVDYLGTAATRAGEMNFAVLLWQSYYQKSLMSPILIPKRPTKRYTDKLAVQALADFTKQMTAMNVPFFLISGTLLGCIRENALLKHDKDVDVGIWEQADLEQFIAKLRTSGYFYILPRYDSHIIVARHVNGVTIDIFIHYRETDNYWHAGGKSRWNNTPFELLECEFLGDKYLIPKNYELYLTENYGADWRIPKIDFDSALDTLNMEIIDEKAMLIYLYKKIISAQLSGKQLSKSYFDMLNQYQKV